MIRKISVSWLIAILFCCCKKQDPAGQENPEEQGGPFPGRLNTYSNYPVYYNGDGLLVQYSYNDPQNANLKCTVKLKWENNQMIFKKEGSPFGISNAVYSRNSFGYCLPSQDDFYNTWQYDSLNQLRTKNSVSYYWSDGNIDSIKYLGQTEIHDYSPVLETRNFGAKYIPALPFVDLYMSKNLRIRTIQKNSSGDTILIRHYTHEFDSAGFVIKETEIDSANGTVQAGGTRYFTYY